MTDMSGRPPSGKNEFTLGHWIVFAMLVVVAAVAGAIAGQHRFRTEPQPQADELAAEKKEPEYSPALIHVIEQLRASTGPSLGEVDSEGNVSPPLPFIGGSSVGYVGGPGTFFLLIHYFEKQATADDLRRMMKDKSPVVRVMAAYLIIRDKNPGTQNLSLTPFQDDLEEVQVARGGCAIETLTVADLVKAMKDDFDYFGQAWYYDAFFSSERPSFGMGDSKKSSSTAPVFATESLAGRAFLDKYYARMDQFTHERVAYLLGKHPEWREALRLWQNAFAAEEALNRRLFAYYQQKNPEVLQWDERGWELSVAVCNCGQHGRVPIVDFDSLFEARAKANAAFAQAFEAFGSDALSNALRDAPQLSGEAFVARIADLEADFNAAVNKGGPLQSLVPLPIEPASTEPIAPIASTVTPNPL